MKIVYDKEKAIQEKQRIDAETPERNHKAKTRNRILTILTILLVAAFVIGTGGVTWYISTLHLGIGGQIVYGFFAMVAAGIVAVGLYLFYCDHLNVIMPAEDYYTPAIQYHYAVENKKILNIKTLGNPPWKLTLVLEDENHIVTEKEINLHFAHKVRTDISETIIDMDNRIVYTPYIQEEA